MKTHSLQSTAVRAYQVLKKVSASETLPTVGAIITEQPEGSLLTASQGYSDINSVEILVHTKSTGTPIVTMYGSNTGGPKKRLVTLTCTDGSAVTESGGSSWIATMVESNVAHVGINGVDTSSDGDIGAARFDNVGNEFLEAVVTGIDAETTVLMRYI